MWSGIADDAKSCMDSIAGVLKDWAASISEWIKGIWKSLGSTGFNFGGGGGGDIGGITDVVDAGWWHKGGFVARYHMGGLTKDEVPIIAKKGEYVLSKEDVDFVNKVKGGGGPSININMGSGFPQKPTIVPMGVTVMMDNSSSAMLQASTSTRQVSDAQYIVDVVLRDINSRGRLARMGR
jgi:hypothetical protein